MTGKKQTKAVKQAVRQAENVQKKINEDAGGGHVRPSGRVVPATEDAEEIASGSVVGTFFSGSNAQ